MFSLFGTCVGLFYLLRGIWYYLLVTTTNLSSPLGASLYNIGTRLCCQRTTSSSSKCKEKVRWRRLFINNGYRENKPTK